MLKDMLMRLTNAKNCFSVLFQFYFTECDRLYSALRIASSGKNRQLGVEVDHIGVIPGEVKNVLFKCLLANGRISDVMLM